MTLNIFLANIISLFHFLVVLFMIIIPFTKVPLYLLLHIVFSLSLLVHWYHNNNICSLSLLESKLRGIEYNNSFTHQFIAPMYDISDTKWIKLCYGITIFLALISLYYLIISPRWEIAKKCYKKTNDYIKKNNKLSFYDKLNLYTNCLDILLKK